MAHCTAIANEADNNSLKPGFHVIATIAAIAENKKLSDNSDRSDPVDIITIYGNHSSAIVAMLAMLNIRECTVPDGGKERGRLHGRSTPLQLHIEQG